MQHKKYGILLAWLLSLTFASVQVNAQFRKVPAAVTESFRNKFPNADNVEWTDKITSFTASYEEDNRQNTSWFDSNGEWKQTETILKLSELPNAVRNAFTKGKYSQWSVEEVSKITKADNGLQYRIYAKGESIIEKMNLYYTADGQLIKSSRKLKID